MNIIVSFLPSSLLVTFPNGYFQFSALSIGGHLWRSFSCCTRTGFLTNQALRWMCAGLPNHCIRPSSIDGVSIVSVPLPVYPITSNTLYVELTSAFVCAFLLLQLPFHIYGGEPICDARVAINSMTACARHSTSTASPSLPFFTPLSVVTSPGRFSFLRSRRPHLFPCPESYSSSLDSSFFSQQFSIFLLTFSDGFFSSNHTKRLKPMVCTSQLQRHRGSGLSPHARAFCRESTRTGRKNVHNPVHSNEAVHHSLVARSEASALSLVDNI